MKNRQSSFKVREKRTILSSHASQLKSPNGNILIQYTLSSFLDTANGVARVRPVGLKQKRKEFLMYDASNNNRFIKNYQLMWKNVK